MPCKLPNYFPAPVYNGRILQVTDERNIDAVQAFISGCFAEHYGASMELVVTDSGPGIDVSEHSRVFQRFYRLADQHVAGSGLGLAIVKEVAEQHDASIALQHSTLSATGLAVRVAFPV